MRNRTDQRISEQLGNQSGTDYILYILSIVRLVSWFVETRFETIVFSIICGPSGAV